MLLAAPSLTYFDNEMIILLSVSAVTFILTGCGTLPYYIDFTAPIYI